ncbi:MAG: aspartate/glutamate racemase family protein [Candidatus Aminicenantes bacterium]|nr:aspartate/glutamate racemase family protein [Candidatus Aminicenantes bacterium]
MIHGKIQRAEAGVFRDDLGKYLKPACLVALIAGFFLSCHGPVRIEPPAGPAVELPLIADEILGDPDSFYYINTSDYPKNRQALPVGVFDSGTGGLTVLEAILTTDEFDNRTRRPGGDGRPDFAAERFIYLADQANMPYGIYSSEGKTSLLVEHVIKDAQFLMSDKYYPDGSALTWTTGKDPVKAVVVACNTATAYGMPYLEAFMSRSGTGLKVIGVIDAGARGALQLFQKGEAGSIGVLATVGTVASGGYEKTLKRLAAETGHEGELQVYSQGGQGIAEAIDGERDFVDKSLTAPRDSYRGPSLTAGDFQIRTSLLPAYNFRFDGNKMLCDSDDPYDCAVMQINDPGNYMRFHLVSLLETMRRTPGALPLKALVLGCTHFPYLSGTIRQALKELYDFRQEGEYRYRPLMAEEIRLVDPSLNVAVELFNHLTACGLFVRTEAGGTSEFYISVPNTGNPDVRVDGNNRFTYDYKYGRTAGEIQQYVRAVPFSRANISDETFQRLAAGTPLTYEAIRRFHAENDKAAGMPDALKIVHESP